VRINRRQELRSVMAQPSTPVPADLLPVQRPPSGVRRAETRYQCGPATPGRLTTDPDAPPIRAWVLNLSGHGAGLLIPNPVEARVEVLIYLKGRSDKQYQLRARIAHCTRQVSGDWMIGCELLTPLSDDDLDDLL
jgi:hypothetical protein